MTKYVSTTTTWKNYIFGYMVATAFGVDKNLNTDCTLSHYIFLLCSKREDERVFDEDILGETAHKKNYCAQFREMKSS